MAAPSAAPIITLDKKHIIDTGSKTVQDDGMRVWIGGESGSGKSSACMLLVSQYIAQGGQALVLDPHGEYSALWGIRPSKVTIFGYGGNYVEDSSVSLVMHHIEEGHSVVLDLSHWALRSKVRGDFVAQLAAELFELRKRKKGRTLLVAEEAHLFAPQTQQKGDAESVRTFVDVVTAGRKFGLHIVLASQRQSLVDSNVVSQCNVRLFLRISEAKDWQKVVKQYLPPKSNITWYQKAPKTDLNQFDSGEAILVSRWWPVERIRLNLPSVKVGVIQQES
jgi:DNA helicase HerA-like ATPase